MLVTELISLLLSSASFLHTCKHANAKHLILLIAAHRFLKKEALKVKLPLNTEAWHVKWPDSHSWICLGPHREVTQEHRVKGQGLIASSLVGLNYCTLKQMTPQVRVAHKCTSTPTACHSYEHAINLSHTQVKLRVRTKHQKLRRTSLSFPQSADTHTRTMNGPDWSRCSCDDVCDSYLVEAVHCRPPLAVRVQYFPAAVRNAHFLFSRQISIWNTSWSLSSSWLAERSIPVRG